MLSSDSLHNRFAQEAVSASAGLLLVDPQEMPLAAMGDAAERVINNLVGLARVAAAFDLPVVITSRQGEGAVIGAVSSLFPAIAVIERAEADVFASGGGVLDALYAEGRRVWYLARWGYGDELAADAIDAMRLRLEMRVVLDACWPAPAIGDATGVARMAKAGVHVTSWVAVLAALSQDQARADLSAQARQAIDDSLANYIPIVPAHWDGESLPL